MSAALTPAIRKGLRRAPLILAESDGYSTDLDLAADLGLTRADMRVVIGILYRRRQVDRIGDYVVLPATRGPVTAPERAA